MNNQASCRKCKLSFLFDDRSNASYSGNLIFSKKASKSGNGRLVYQPPCDSLEHMPYTLFLWGDNCVSLWVLEWTGFRSFVSGAAPPFLQVFRAPRSFATASTSGSLRVRHDEVGMAVRGVCVCGTTAGVVLMMFGRPSSKKPSGPQLANERMAADCYDESFQYFFFK